MGDRSAESDCAAGDRSRRVLHDESPPLLEFVNDSGYEYRVVQDGNELQLWHRPPPQFRAKARGDRWDRGVAIMLSSAMALNPALGAQVIQMYMVRTLTYAQFEGYRKMLENG